LKGASSLQSSFNRLVVAAEDHQRLTEAELSKVRACIVKTRGFSTMDQQQLDTLIKSGRRSVYDTQEALIVQNDDNVGYFFVLIEGSFKYVVESDSEVSKSGFISCTDHGNMVGHFGSLYQRRRDSSVYSVPGAVAWRFSLDGIPGAPLRSASRFLCAIDSVFCIALPHVMQDSSCAQMTKRSLLRLFPSVKRLQSPRLNWPKASRVTVAKLSSCTPH
jgi:hypothetical protein